MNRNQFQPVRGAVKPPHVVIEQVAGHIRQPMTTAEICAEIDAAEYSSELMMQHLLLRVAALEKMPEPRPAPKPPAHKFSTITDADWARELKAARERGAAEGNELLAKIRAAQAVEDAIGQLRNCAGWWEGDQKARKVLHELLHKFCTRNQTTMSTHTKDPEETAALEYLRARAASEGINGMTLGMTSDPDAACSFWARASDPSGREVNCYGFGASISEAIAGLRKELAIASASKHATRPPSFD